MKYRLFIGSYTNYRINRNYRSLSEIDINRSHNFFLDRFLSIDIGNRYSSMVDIDTIDY